MNSPSESPIRWKQWAVHLSVEATLLLLLGAVYFLSGASGVVKTMTSLAMPVGVIWVGLVHLTLNSIQIKNYASFGMTMFVLLLLTGAGNSSVANWTMGSLESKFYDQQQGHEPFDIVHVLGGATGIRPDGRVEVNANGDRLVEVARLYHQGLVKTIYCSGQPIAGFSVLERSEAELSQEILKELGVAERDLRILEGRNTHEEIRSLAELIHPGMRVGVVTSAWHLQRAMKLIEEQKLDVVPLPADFRSGKSDGPTPLGRRLHQLIPTSAALDTTTKAIREHLAMVVNR